MGACRRDPVYVELVSKSPLRSMLYIRMLPLWALPFAMCGIYALHIVACILSGSCCFFYVPVVSAR